MCTLSVFGAVSRYMMCARSCAYSILKLFGVVSRYSNRRTVSFGLLLNLLDNLSTFPCLPLPVLSSKRKRSLAKAIPDAPWREGWGRKTWLIRRRWLLWMCRRASAWTTFSDKVIFASPAIFQAACCVCCVRCCVINSTPPALLRQHHPILVEYTNWYNSPLQPTN